MSNKPHDRLSDGRDRLVTLARAKNGSTAMRVTLGFGRTRRIVILEHPPFPEVGDTVTLRNGAVTLNNGGAGWTVRKVQPTTVLLRLGRVKQAGEAPGAHDAESHSLQSVQTQKKKARGTSQTSEK